MAAVVAALTGCGNYSTEDLRFLAALPTREDLQVAVPSGGNPGALTVCPIGRADVWLWAKPTSDGLNRGVGFVVGLIDVVRKVPPTVREENLRRWGPFPDKNHPGHEIQVVIERSYPDGPPVHGYAFEARAVGNPTFDPLIVGTFMGASSSRGHGTVDLFFDSFWTVGVNDDTTPHGTMQITYDRASDPVTIELDLTQDAVTFGVVQFDYGFAGYGDGRGRFDYRFRESNGDVLTVITGYDAAGAGRAAVAYDPANPFASPGGFRVCWDAAACLTYVDDPYNYLGACSSAPCSIPGPCADVPQPAPFVP